MTYVYLILLLCTFTNANWQNEDMSVADGIVPNVHRHAVHEKNVREVAEDHRSRYGAVEDVSVAPNDHMTGRSSQGLGEYSTVPQDDLNALEEMRRRGRIMQIPPMPLQVTYQIRQKIYTPQRQTFYDISKNADETSAAKHESIHGDDDAVIATRRQQLEDEKRYYHPQYDVGSRSEKVHPITVHAVSRSSEPGQIVGVHRVVDGVVDAVKTPYVNVGVSEASHEAVRYSKPSPTEEAVRAGLYDLDEADHTANRSPVDVNRVNPTYDTLEDSRESISRLGGMGGLGSLRGFSGMKPFGEIGGMVGLGGMSGILTSPNGMKIYNIPQYPSPLANQFPVVYGK